VAIHIETYSEKNGIREYESGLSISLELLARGRLLGFETFDLTKAVANSARITHPKGNRRYDDLIFTVENNLVTSVHLIQCDTCNDHKKIIAYDDCATCDGMSCRTCPGQIKRTWACPDCTNYNLTN